MKKRRQFSYFGMTEDNKGVILAADGEEFVIKTRRGGKTNDLNRVFTMMSLVMSDSDWEVVRAGLMQHDANKLAKRALVARANLDQRKRKDIDDEYNRDRSERGRTRD